jgi:hypothetical protein
MTYRQKRFKVQVRTIKRGLKKLEQEINKKIWLTKIQDYIIIDE